MPLKLTTYRKGEDIPMWDGSNVFHSRELFFIYEATPGYAPMLVVATDDDRPIAQLLAAVRINKRLMPPSIVRRCEVYGTGEYFDDSVDKEYVFSEMLAHFTRVALRGAFMIEFRNLENALFGYRFFRSNGYFPVNWLRVRNSLGELKSAEEDISPSRMRQIRRGLKHGASVREARSDEEVLAFAKMLHKIYSAHIRRHFPNIAFFKHVESQFVAQNRSKIFVVRYKEKIIGGAACIYSGESAYLWFSGGMTKKYAKQYPGILAVWMALKDAYERGYKYLEFMDVGLPFSKHGYRDFVLRFGGQQISTRRWYRFRWGWLNKLLIQIYV